MDILQNDIIRLRAIEPEDIDIIYQWENETDVWKVSNTITPFSRYIIKRYIENAHLDIYQAKQLRLMIDLIETKKAIGSIDLFDFDPFHNRAGVGMLIADKESRGKGYASLSLHILINYAFNVLNLHQLYCNIPEDNTVSLSLFKKHGFKIIGEKKEWLKTSSGFINEYILQLIAE